MIISTATITPIKVKNLGYGDSVLISVSTTTYFIFGDIQPDSAANIKDKAHLILTQYNNPTKLPLKLFIQKFYAYQESGADAYIGIFQP